MCGGVWNGWGWGVGGWVLGWGVGGGGWEGGGGSGGGGGRARQTKHYAFGEGAIIGIMTTVQSSYNCLCVQCQTGSCGC